MKSIMELDRKLSVSPSPELYKARQNLQMNYNLLSTQDEYGKKAGNLLSHQIKSKSASQQIKQIRTPSGELTVIPSVINETFRTFYSELYTSQSPADDTIMTRFLNN